MAETVVNLVIEQLTQLVVDEVKLLSGVKNEFTQIKSDLESIRAFLKDADSRQHSDEAVKAWVNQVRDVAYDIENVIDEFLFRIGRPHGRGFLRKSTRFFRHFLSRYRIASEMQSIKNQIRAISDRRREFSFASSIVEGTNPSPHDPRLTTALFVEESEVVGIDKPKTELTALLLREDPNPLMISVVGMGVVGKTTVVRKVKILRKEGKSLAYGESQDN